MNLNNKCKKHIFTIKMMHNLNLDKKQLKLYYVEQNI